MRISDSPICFSSWAIEPLSRADLAPQGRPVALERQQAGQPLQALLVKLAHRRQFALDQRQLLFDGAAFEPHRFDLRAGLVDLPEDQADLSLERVAARLEHGALALDHLGDLRVGELVEDLLGNGISTSASRSATSRARSASALR